jgi:Flp pilus assembly protein TadG
MKRTHSSGSPDRRRESNRNGAIAPLAALLLIPLLGLAALAIDYAYLLNVRTDLQRAADAAALAAVRDLSPDSTGNQNLSTVRATVQSFAASNLPNISGFTVRDADITIGRYDPATAYSNFTLLNTGTFDTVQVTLRRDSLANSPVSLYFARILGISNSGITATSTAVLQKANRLEPGADVLPFAVPKTTWDSRAVGSQWSIYGDGHVTDASGSTIPGNWGTVDIGPSNNSTSALSAQILDGLTQADLDALYNQNRIPQREYIDAAATWMANADPGLSAGIKSAVQAIHGQTRLVPIYDSVSGNGNNAEYRIVGWGVVVVVDSHWTGSNKSVTVKKSYAYDRQLRGQGSLSSTSGTIEGAYTSPALVK